MRAEGLLGVPRNWVSRGADPMPVAEQVKGGAEKDGLTAAGERVERTPWSVLESTDWVNKKIGENLTSWVSPDVPIKNSPWEELRNGIGERKFAALKDLEGGRYVALNLHRDAVPQPVLKDPPVFPNSYEFVEVEPEPEVWLDPMIWGDVIKDLNRLFGSVGVSEDVVWWVTEHACEQLPGEVPFEMALMRSVNVKTEMTSVWQVMVDTRGRVNIGSRVADYDLGNLDPERDRRAVVESFFDWKTEEWVGLRVQGMFAVQEKSGVE